VHLAVAKPSSQRQTNLLVTILLDKVGRRPRKYLWQRAFFARATLKIRTRIFLAFERLNRHTQARTTKCIFDGHFL
jgi:hypothetical protein